jgi:hypothetical protein
VIADQLVALRRQSSLMKKRLEALSTGVVADAERLGDAKRRLLQVCALRADEAERLNHNIENAAFLIPEQWVSLMALSKKFRALAADCMGLAQSVVFRNIDPACTSLCAVGDKLSEEFSRSIGQPRRHYVSVSEAEHFGAEASAIHLSYARLEIWNLNRVAHEFGHLWSEEFAGDENAPQSSFIRLLVPTKEIDESSDSWAMSGDDGDSPTSWTEDQAKEFFADIVAAFLMGLAYGYSCLHLDFNPADRIASSTSHPSADERAYCILIALDQLAKTYEGNTALQMVRLTKDLGEFWSASREAAGAGGPIVHLPKLRLSVQTAIVRLEREFPGAKYRNMALANAVDNALRNGDPRPAKANCVDILNGAWLRKRVARPTDERAIQQESLKMLLTV